MYCKNVYLGLPLEICLLEVVEFLVLCGTTAAFARLATENGGQDD